MKKVFDKITNVPIAYSASLISILTVVSVLTYTGSIGIAGAIAIISIGLTIILNIVIGPIVFKSLVAGLTIVYSAALYTDMVLEFYGNITEPFLLTLASVTLFLAQTYDGDKYNYNIRSRPLWSSILGVSISIIKMTLILSGASFIIAELVGAIYLVIYTIAWRYWVNNSKKTKIISPEVIDTEDEGRFRFIYINNNLVFKDMSWDANDNLNAYPFILNEAMKANEDELILVLISKENTSKLYDVGNIEANKYKSIPYLYMEAKEDTYYNDIMAKFIEEISISNQI